MHANLPALKSKAFYFLIATLLTALNAVSQTNPSPQPLPYFQNFGTSTFTSLPEGFASWTLNTKISSETQVNSVIPKANATVTAATAVVTTAGTYGYAKSNDAKVYIQTASNGAHANNQLVLAISTGAATSIKLNFTLEGLNSGKRNASVLVQYRKEGEEAWTSTGSAQTISATGQKSYEHIIEGLSINTNYQIRWAVWSSSSSGGTYQAVAIDDISVEAAGPLVIKNISQNKFCSANSNPLSIDFITSTIWFINQFTAQLSDNTGSFANPLNIGSVWSGSTQNSVNASLPANLPSGTYRVRLVSLLPSYVSNPVEISIYGINKGNFSFNNGDSICFNTQPLDIVLNGFEGNIQRWQSSTNGTTWTNISNQTATQKISALSKATYYRAVIDAGFCGTINTDSLLVNIKVCKPALPDSGKQNPNIITPGHYVFYKRDSSYSLSALSAPGAQLRWYTQPAGGSFTTTPPIPSTNKVGIYTYYVSQFAAGMESNRVEIFIEIKPITWDGKGGKNWETHESWKGGQLPLDGDEVAIAEDAVEPIRLTKNMVVGKLIFGNAGDSSYIKLNGKKLVIQDSILGHVSFEGNDLSEVEIKGATKNIIQFKTAGRRLKNFIIDHSGADIKLGSNLDIYGVFSVASGSFDLNGDTLALKAGVYPQTGMVGNTNGDVHQSNGLFLVERFMPARRAYRLLSASVNSVNPIIDNWQEGVHNTTRIYSSNLDPHPGYGTHITGSKNGANGFDATRSGNPSMFTYNNDAGTWHAIANTNATYLVAGQPYRIIVRGDRSIDMNTNTPPPTNTILRSWGTILQGNQTKPLSSTAGQFNMIGNPYAAAVNLADVTKVNASDIIYIWDPNMQNSETATSIGAYVTYDLSTGISTMEDESEVNQYLQPGQGFFIQTIANGPASLTFKESDKYTDGTTQTFKTSNAGLSKIQVKLYVDTLNAKASDGCAIVFNGNYSNDAVTGEDGFKLSNSFENISMLVGNNKLSINKRSYPVSSDTIMLNLTGYTSGNYRLHINATNVVLGGMNAFLVDAYTQTETPLDMINENVIAFDINNSIAASKAADRFMIVFKQGTTLPVSFIQISAKNEDEKNVVLWRATQQEPVTVFEVERSADGKKFEKIGSVKPQQSESYRFDDNGFLTGKNYYRVKVKSVEGKEKYSSVVVVNNSGERKGEMSIYPNPVVGRKMNIGMKQVATGEYRIMIINGAGQNVWQSTLNYNGEATKTIQLPSSIVPGMYSVKIMGKDESFFIQVIIK